MNKNESSVPAYLARLSEKELKTQKEGQQKILDMLIEFDDFCKKYKLKYWCVGGSLIGAIRHQGWVPWDGDMDVAMLQEDYAIVRQHIQKELSKEFWLQDSSVDSQYNAPNLGKIRLLNSNYRDYKPRKWHNGLQLDIFVCKKKGGFIFTPRWKNFLLRGKYLTEDIFPTKRLKFENTTICVPACYESLSIKQFGSCPPPYPPPDKQYPHEGRFELTAPEWVKKKYPHLYNN